MPERRLGRLGHTRAPSPCRYGLTWALEIFVGILFAVAAHTALTRLRCAMFSNLVQQDVAFYDAHVSGELASRLINDSGQLQSLVQFVTQVWLPAAPNPHPNPHPNPSLNPNPNPNPGCHPRPASTRPPSARAVPSVCMQDVLKATVRIVGGLIAMYTTHLYLGLLATAITPVNWLIIRKAGTVQGLYGAVQVIATECLLEGIRVPSECHRSAIGVLSIATECHFVTLVPGSAPCRTHRLRKPTRPPLRRSAVCVRCTPTRARRAVRPPTLRPVDL